jgi:hypothetical protein
MAIFSGGEAIQPLPQEKRSRINKYGERMPTSRLVVKETYDKGQNKTDKVLHNKKTQRFCFLIF